MLIEPSKRRRELRPTRRSLLTIPSKSEGFIQPSVTSQPPKFTAFMGIDGGVVADDTGVSGLKIKNKKKEKCKRTGGGHWELHFIV